MNYEEAIEATVTFTEAWDEIIKHGQSMTDFVNETGAKEEYKGAEVLNWLGY